MRLSIGIVWLMSLIAAFFVGYQYQSKSELDITLDSGSIEKFDNLEQTLGEVLTDKISNPRIEKTSLSASPNDAQRSVTELVTEIELLIGDPDVSAYSSIAQAYLLIENLDLNQTKSALEQLKHKANDPNHLNMVMMFLSKYASFEPADAMSYVVDNVTVSPNKMLAKSTVMREWTKNKPLEALDWYQSNKDLASTKRGGYTPLKQIFKSLAKQDLSFAVASLSELSSDDSERISAIRGIANSLKSSEEFSYLVEQTQNLDNKEITESALFLWATKQPLEALDWVNRIDDQTRLKELEDEVYNTWLRNQPDAAAESYIASATSENLDFRAKKIVESTAFEDPQWALTWIQSQSGIKSEKLITDLLTITTYYKNPNFAAENLHLITDKENYLDVSRSIYEGYERINQTKADQFLASAPNKENLEKEIQKFRKYRKKSK